MIAVNLLVAIALLLANAFFVAAEFAAVGVRRAQIEPLARTSRRAQRVLDAQRELSLLLAGAQLGITLCSLGLGAVAEPSVAAVLEKVLHAVHLPDDLAHPLAFVVALLLVVLLHMVVGEMVPKNISLATSERAAIALVPPLATFVRITRPVISLLNHLANGTLRLARVEPQDELKSAYTTEELADILAESSAEGLLPSTEHDRMTGALGLNARTAGDIAVPFAKVVTVSPSAGSEEIEQLTARTGLSRFPVNTGGRMVGFVHVKDLLDAGEGFRADQHARPMPLVAPSTPLPEVLTALRQGGSHLACVGDAEGTLGMLALEDVVQVLVNAADGDDHRGVRSDG